MREWLIAMTELPVSALFMLAGHRIDDKIDRMVDETPKIYKGMSQRVRIIDSIPSLTPAYENTSNSYLHYNGGAGLSGCVTNTIAELFIARHHTTVIV